MRGMEMSSNTAVMLFPLRSMTSRASRPSTAGMVANPKSWRICSATSRTSSSSSTTSTVPLPGRSRGKLLLVRQGDVERGLADVLAANDPGAQRDGTSRLSQGIRRVGDQIHHDLANLGSIGVHCRQFGSKLPHQRGSLGNGGL